MDAIVDSLLARRRGVTAVGSLEVWSKDPLDCLLSLCIHKDICIATMLAIEATEEKNPHLRTILGADWDTFVTAIATYQSVWKQVSTDRVSICDNFEVRHITRLVVTVPEFMYSKA